MKTRSRLPLWFGSLLVLAALACNASGAPTPYATSAAATVDAILTASAVAGGPSATPLGGSPTPSLTPTGQASASAQPEQKPSDTPGPTNTPGAQGCADNAQFVADVTIPDNTVLNPGAAFTKTWRLRNNGACTWVSSYALAFVSGEALGGPPAVAIVGSVPPGATYDISVNLVAPNTPGLYKGTWRMRNTANAFFGSQPYVQIVVAAPSATPTHTQAASPTPTYTASPTATHTQPAPLTWPLVQQGDNGANVYAVQHLLIHRGATITADGAFGPQTRAAVQAFQTANSLAADGIVGPDTWPKLIVTVQQGSTGQAVRAVQRLLNDKYGFALTVDGIFGPATDTAVKAFQGSHSLTMDGIVGQQTWSALVSN